MLTHMFDRLHRPVSPVHQLRLDSHNTTCYKTFFKAYSVLAIALPALDQEEVLAIVQTQIPVLVLPLGRGNQRQMFNVYNVFFRDL